MRSSLVVAIFLLSSSPLHAQVCLDSKVQEQAIASYNSVSELIKDHGKVTSIANIRNPPVAPINGYATCSGTYSFEDGSRQDMGYTFASESTNPEKKELNVSAWKLLPSKSTAWIPVSYDSSTIERNGNSVRIWFLQEFNMPPDKDGKPFLSGAPGKEFLSHKYQNEYDCSRGMSRGLRNAFYSGHKATGKIVEKSDRPLKWVSLKDESEIKIACGSIVHRDYSQDEPDGMIHAVFICYKQMNQCQLYSQGRQTFMGYAPGIVFSTDRECQDNIPKNTNENSPFYFECRSKPDWN